jgi:UDP-GlcNAc:undecaprenyl-phosphate GlcNAc-1-phosphate transferase
MRVYLFALVMLFWGLTATPVSIGLARKFRLLDKPGGRKKHLNITPRGAGLVLWSGYILWALFVGNPGVEVPYVATGATVIFILGYMDDMRSLSPLMRLVCHLAAALWVVYPLPVPLWQRLLCVFWITGTTNAYNFIDGMDGLCLSVTLITAVLAAFFTKNLTLWLPLSTLVFSVLLWNFPKPLTFLGDGGSTLLGYICSSHLAWNIFPSLFGKNIFYVLFLLLLLGGVPVIDTLIVMTKRVFAKRSPFSPDRGHAHHKLQDIGCSKTQTLVIIGAVHFVLLSFGFRFTGLF